MVFHTVRCTERRLVIIRRVPYDSAVWGTGGEPAWLHILSRAEHFWLPFLSLPSSGYRTHCAEIVSSERAGAAHRSHVLSLSKHLTSLGKALLSGQFISSSSEKVCIG